MAGNDDGVVIDRGETGIASRNRAVDAAAGGIIDERIDPVPEDVADVNDIGLGEGDGDVAVGMRRTIMFQADRCAIELQLVLLVEYLAR